MWTVLLEFGRRSMIETDSVLSIYCKKYKVVPRNGKEDENKS